MSFLSMTQPVAPVLTAFPIAANSPPGWIILKLPENVLFNLNTSGSWVPVGAMGPVELELDCAAAVIVQDLVYISGVTGVAEKACAAPGVLMTSPALGVVVEKVSATKCYVVCDGLVDIFLGLTPGDRFFTGLVPGVMTNTIPTKGVFGMYQEIGEASPDGQLVTDFRGEIHYF